jgi:hypothetical protein
MNYADTNDPNNYPDGYDFEAPVSLSLWDILLDFHIWLACFHDISLDVLYPAILRGDHWAIALAQQSGVLYQPLVWDGMADWYAAINAYGNDDAYNRKAARMDDFERWIAEEAVALHGGRR